MTKVYQNPVAHLQQDLDHTERTPLLRDGNAKNESEKEKSGKDKEKKPSLLKVLVKTFGVEFLHAQVFKLFYDGLIFLFPQLLQ